MLRVSVVKPLLPRVEVSVLRHWQEKLRHGRLSWIGVSPPWKTEYLEGCSTAIRRVARKVAAMEGRLVWFRGSFTMGTLFPDRWTCIWQVVINQTRSQMKEISGNQKCYLQMTSYEEHVLIEDFYQVINVQMVK